MARRAAPHRLVWKTLELRAQPNGGSSGGARSLDLSLQTTVRSGRTAPGEPHLPGPIGSHSCEGVDTRKDDAPGDGSGSRIRASCALQIQPVRRQCRDILNDAAAPGRRCGRGADPGNVQRRATCTPPNACIVAGRAQWMSQKSRADTRRARRTARRGWRNAGPNAMRGGNRVATLPPQMTLSLPPLHRCCRCQESIARAPRPDPAPRATGRR